MADQLSGEQKKQFNKMKHDLEGYREVILLVNSILKWDKPFYAGIIFGVVSISFSLLWYLNLSILTLVSLLCLIGILSEYAFPIVSKFIPKSDNWTGVQEKIFEDVCNEILTVKIKTCCFVKYLFVSKQEKTLMYYITTCIGFAVLAYIGCIIDNLLLSYLATLFIAYYPGLHRHGIVKNVFGKLITCYSKQLKTIQDKSTKKVN